MKLRNTRFIFLIFEFQTNSKSTCSCLQYLLYQCLPTVQILSYYRLDTFANFNPTPASPRANLEPNAISRYCNTAIREVQQVFPLISSHATAPPLLTMCEVGHATRARRGGNGREDGWKRGWKGERMHGVGERPQLCQCDEELRVVVDEMCNATGM